MVERETIAKVVTVIVDIFSVNLPNFSSRPQLSKDVKREEKSPFSSRDQYLGENMKHRSGSDDLCVSPLAASTPVYHKA